MKKIIYSSITKLVAVMLFIVSIVVGSLGVISGVTDYNDFDVNVYRFESSFNEARYFSYLFDQPESEIFSVFHSFYSASTNGELPLTLNGETIEERIKQALDSIYCVDKINYYVLWNSTVFTNCDAESGEELTNAQFYRYTSRDENGNVQLKTNQENHHWYRLLDELSFHDEIMPIVIATSVKDEYVNECKMIWDRQVMAVTTAFAFGTVCLVISLISLIYLICVCGKTSDGKYKSMWVDRIPTELQLITVAALAAGTLQVGYILFNEGYTNGFFTAKMVFTALGICIAIVSLALIATVLSIVRNIKNKRFIKSWMVLSILWSCVKTFFASLRWIRNKILGFRNLIFSAISKKTGFMVIGSLILYTACIGLIGLQLGAFGIYGLSPQIFVISGIILFVVTLLALSVRIKDLESIKKGVHEVRGGNVSYKIEEVKYGDMKMLSENINDISRGLDEAVAANVKAERMKAELITNVSHDLKTPITSIINYAELLSHVESLPDEASDYVAVIAKKGERLKKLTEDLFDISKVQSGNESVELERLDVALLLNQSLAEFDSEIEKSSLTFCVKAGSDMHIIADGRKMSRVMSNLISNILKYSMSGTRVFITAVARDGDVLIEFKNISSYPMSFSADEIVGRFVRGDASRTGDGNGLGLSIAKSYTELCGGIFDIILDGDMFKVIIRLKKEN